MLTSGLSFNQMMQRDIDARASLTGKQIADRLRQRTTTTNKPPAPGDGPPVTGTAMSLLLAMTGRSAGLDDLSGDGAARLGQRLTAGLSR